MLNIERFVDANKTIVGLNLACRCKKQDFRFPAMVEESLKTSKFLNLVMRGAIRSDV